MANSSPRQALIFNLQKKLFSLSRDQLQVIVSLIDNGPANNVDVLSVPELYNLIVDFIRSEKLSSLEDEGLTQLLLLDDLISDLLASNGGAAGDDPTTPLRTHDASASQSGCPNPIYSDRESAPPDTDIPLRPTHTASNVSTQSPAHLDSDAHTHMSQTDRDGSPARASTAATPAESPTVRENDLQKQQDPPAQGSAEMVAQSPAGSPSGNGKRNFFSGKFFLAGSAVLGGISAVALAPVVLGAVGFTSAGIAAGSYAASMMSAAAVANGGGVAAGSLVAILQSAGAVGLSAAASTAVAGVGAGVGAGIGATAGLLAGSTNNQEDVNKEDKDKKDEDEKNDGENKDKEEKSEEEEESEGEKKKKKK